MGFRGPGAHFAVVLGLHEYDGVKGAIGGRGLSVTSGNNPAAPLDGLQWLLPRVADLFGGWKCPEFSNASVVIGGDPATLYDVTLRFVGVIEHSTYTGSTDLGDGFLLGGTSIRNGYNIYQLTISDPFKHYFVNGNADSGAGAIDYTKTITIQGGATVTLFADSIEEFGYPGFGLEDAHTISVPGVTSPAQPYLGQFINMSVISAVPH